ncbi:MAG: transporter associated domain-containing protein, partial [Comamonas sp.]
EDFAVILNEYSLVVGVVTLNDVMSTVMGDLVSPDDEEQIIQRDDRSWLIDGVTSIDDVMRALDLESLPNEEEYETLAGFLMIMLRRVPRRTDSVDWGGFRFEVMDVDSYRIDQVLVTRMQDSEGQVLQHPASALSAVAAVAATETATAAAPVPAAAPAPAIATVAPPAPVAPAANKGDTPSVP